MRLLLVLAMCTALLPAEDNRVRALREAAASIDQNDLAHAARTIEELLQRRPADAVALNLLGVVRMRQGDAAEAERLFGQAVKNGPRLPGPHINLAALYGPARAQDAIAQLSEALALAPHDIQAESALRAVAEQGALAAVKAGDREKALGLMLHARHALPHDAQLLYKFSLVAMECGMFSDAEAALDEALKQRPDFPEATYALARAYLGESRASEAEQQLRRYLAMRPDDASARYGLGYVLMSEQKLDAARSAFEQSLAIRPEQTESLFQLGEIAMQREDQDAARGYFEKVLARQPGHAGALTETGVFAFRAGRYGDAEQILRRAVAGAPGYQKAHYYLALTLAKEGQKSEASREFQIATDLQKKADPVRRLAALPE